MTAVITKRNARDKAFIGGGSGGGGDYPLDADFDTIKVSKNATFTVNDENITFANHESRIKLLEQSGGGGTGDSSFTTKLGYDYFYIKNENIDSEELTYNSIKYYQLSINGIPSTTIDSLKQVDEHLDIFRFILRKNEIFDDVGNFIKEFYCYVENKKLYCPIITQNSVNSTTSYKIEYVEVSLDDTTLPSGSILPCKPYIAFDERVPFVPYDLLLSGEISIMYLLPQNTIESKIPEIKCDIITARNAFKLHESNVPYLYKPSIITEDDTHYIMKFYIAPDFTIPTNMNFVFREMIFMNNWTLSWTGTEWIGNNIQGRSNGKMKNQLNDNCGESSNRFVAIGINKNEFNNHIITSMLGVQDLSSHYVLKNILTRHAMKVNGKFDNGDDFTVTRNGLASFQSMMEYSYSATSVVRYPVYDNTYGCIIMFTVRCDYHILNQVRESYINHISEIHLILDIGGGENIFTFKLISTDVDDYGMGKGYGLYFKGVNDVADVLNVCIQQSNIDKTDKSVTLYLDKGTIRSRPEINWDPSINPFQFIIDEQFYTVSPNPNAATTLYTDFNITSSKIITADNITTMRSDLNVVANTTDVIDADVKALTTKVEKIEFRVTTVEGKVQYLENEVEKIKIMDGIGMAFSVVAGAVIYGPKILEIGGNFLKIGTNAIRNLCSRFTSTAEVDMLNFLEEDFVENLLPFEPLVTYSETENEESKVDLTNMLEWINTEHVEPKFSSKYAETGADDCNNPENMYVSYYAVQNTCMYYRDSLKPAFKLIIDKFDEVDERVKQLEKGNLTNPDFERRIAILEAKCKNITLESDIDVQSETLAELEPRRDESLTLEERLQILERKCANIV